MQPSEMTNEKILSLAELCFFEDHSVEEDQQTAAVLRDYVRMRRQIAELHERIKIAEEALKKCVNYNNSWELRAAEENAKNALAAIREKGGNNGK